MGIPSAYRTVGATAVAALALASCGRTAAPRAERRAAPCSPTRPGSVTRMTSSSAAGVRKGASKPIERRVVGLHGVQPGGERRGGEARLVAPEQRILGDVETRQVDHREIRAWRRDLRQERELNRVELRGASQECARRVVAGIRERAVGSRRGGRFDVRPPLAQRFVQAGRRDLGIERAAAFEPQGGAVAQHDARIRPARARSPTS